MKTRAITGLIFIVVMLGSLFCGPYVFSGFYILLSVLCLLEFYRLVQQAGVKPKISAGIVNSLILFGTIAAGTYLYHQGQHNVLLFLPMLTMPAIFITELYRPSKAPFTNIAYTFLGIIFTVLPWIFFHQLAFIFGTFNPHFPLAFFIMLWANDTGAYLVGMAIGRHKLFERHSPKKTWEGFIGGILIAVGVSVLIAHYFTELELSKWIRIALFISCIGTMGDLVESMFKRSINVKDSGGILPGHGGFLDRFDGLLMAAPVVYAYLYLFS